MIHPALPNPDQIARQHRGGCKTAISFGSGLRIIIGERHTYAAPHGTHLTNEHGDRVILFLEEGNGQGPEAA